MHIRFNEEHQIEFSEDTLPKQEIVRSICLLVASDYTALMSTRDGRSGRHYMDGLQEAIEANIELAYGAQLTDLIVLALLANVHNSKSEDIGITVMLTHEGQRTRFTLCEDKYSMVRAFRAKRKSGPKPKSSK